MREARARLLEHDRPDWWRPVLFMRLRSGRLWYARGLSGGAQDPGGLDKWQALLTNIEDGSCTPILGPGLVDYLLGNRREIAYRWARREHFPMSPHDIENLPQVAQYLITRHDNNYPRVKLERQLRREMRERYGDILAEASYTRLRAEGVGEEDMQEQLALALEDMPLDQQVSLVGRHRMKQDPAEPHLVLASLPLRIYVTANYGDFMTDALHRCRKMPRVELYRWHDRAKWPSRLLSVFASRRQRLRGCGQLDHEDVRDALGFAPFFGDVSHVIAASRESNCLTLTDRRQRHPLRCTIQVIAVSACSSSR